MIRAARVDIPLAHCVIHPEIGHIGLADLVAVNELIAAGYAATVKQMPEILGALGLATPDQRAQSTSAESDDWIR